MQTHTIKRKRKNPYNIDDVMKRDNCTLDEAIDTINELKSRTSGSLQTFQKRYGEEIGLIKYNEFSNKSAHTEESFIKKYGESGKEKYLKYLKSKDSTSLKFFITKYGKELGQIKHKEKIETSIHTLENFVKKYGEEIGSEKYKAMNDARSLSCSTYGLTGKYGRAVTLKINKSKARPGAKNGMFGKPSPKGSGNGWQGWYNDMYFRSLLELSYMKYLCDNSVKFVSGEKLEYSVSYNDGEIDRNYFCDFVLIDSNVKIEIKPSNLINSYINKKKFGAAKEKFGKYFKILTEKDFPILTDSELNELVLSEKVKFIERYMIKFNERYKNENS